MPRRLLIGLVAAVLIPLAILLYGWFGPGPLGRDASIIVGDGATLTSTASELERIGAIPSSKAFLIRARILASADPIKAGEFLLPAGASQSRILAILQGSDIVRRMITIPEGMPSVMVRDRLMAVQYLTGDIPVPAEGSVLPDTYDFARGESRAAVLARMQAAMQQRLKDLWAKRAPGLVVKTPPKSHNTARNIIDIPQLGR